MKVYRKFGIKEKDYGEWGSPDERIVYKDNQFVIVKHKAHTKTGFCYEIIPIDEKERRLKDIQICPEPDTFQEAIKMLKEYKNEI